MNFKKIGEEISQHFQAHSEADQKLKKELFAKILSR